MKRLALLTVLGFGLAGVAQAQNTLTLTQTGNNHAAQLAQSNFSTATITQNGSYNWVVNNLGGPGYPVPPDPSNIFTQSNSILTVLQTGQSNTVEGSQSTTGTDRSTTTVTQTGSWQTTDVNQSGGEDNDITTVQNGLTPIDPPNNDDEEIRQYAGVSQIGTGHRATVDQDGISNFAGIDQTLAANTTDIDQTGDENVVGAVAGGADPTDTADRFLQAAGSNLDVTQTGNYSAVLGEQSGSSALIVQNGTGTTVADFNVVTLDQTGADGTFAPGVWGVDAQQDGFSNIATITQNGDSYTESDQVGDTNTATVTQTGPGHTADVNQNGSGNNITITQN